MKPNELSKKLRIIASRLDNSKNPNKDLVIAELNKLVASMTKTSSAGSDEIVNFLYPGHEDFESEPLSSFDGTESGSSIWWAAFIDAGNVDWTPVTDYASVEAKVKQLLENASKTWSNGKYTIDQLLQSMKDNYDTYVKYYQKDDIAKLKEAGLLKLKID